MRVSVKVYLNQGMEEPEIRRFSVNEEVSSNFEDLRTKITSIFPSVQGKKLHVYWKGMYCKQLASFSISVLRRFICLSNSSHRGELYAHSNWNSNEDVFA